MNERIKELAYEAEDYADSIVDQGGEFHPAYTKKFAELIVQDILTVVKSEHKLALEFQLDTDDTAIAIRDAIKKRFGDKE